MDCDQKHEKKNELEMSLQLAARSPPAHPHPRQRTPGFTDETRELLARVAKRDVHDEIEQFSVELQSGNAQIIAEAMQSALRKAVPAAEWVAISPSPLSHTFFLCRSIFFFFFSSLGVLDLGCKR